jgi:RNA-directed DNA polymerase
MTNDEKYQLICMLTRRGYKALPLKRIYIPKSNGTLRPLSIPTMKDRAMQTLYKFALEPIAELTADDCSFGFRPERSARGAIARCVDILTDNSNMRSILKADIRSCFDNISHKWILDNIPVDRKTLSNFLKCGYIDNGVFYETAKGVPQSGCLSTVICNMTLDGLEKILANEVWVPFFLVNQMEGVERAGVE